MDQWLLAVTSGSAAKQLAKVLEVVSPGTVHCHFPPPPSLSYHVYGGEGVYVVNNDVFPRSLMRVWEVSAQYSFETKYSFVV